MRTVRIVRSEEEREQEELLLLLLLLLDYCLCYYSTVNTITTTATIVRWLILDNLLPAPRPKRLAPTGSGCDGRRRRRVLALRSPLDIFLSGLFFFFFFTSSSPLPFTPFPLLSFCFASSADCPSLSSTLTLLSGLRGRYPSPRHPPHFIQQRPEASQLRSRHRLLRRQAASTTLARDMIPDLGPALALQYVDAQRGEERKMG